MMQVRIARAKGEAELVDGPDGATVVVRVAWADARLDPAVAFMQGKLKAEGHTGELFDRLSDGSVASALARLLS